MGKLILGTNVVSLDEPCFSLKEIVAPGPDSHSRHRYQCIKVIRQGDQLAEMRRDLGPAERFSCQEFVIPGGVADSVTGRIEILHTVGELIDIAEVLHSDQYDRPPPPAASNLVQGFFDQVDKRKKRCRGQSQFGPHARIQRT